MKAKLHSFARGLSLISGSGHVIVFSLLALMLLVPSFYTFAQTPAVDGASGGSVCALAFLDTDKHQSRQAGAPLLTDINVSLMVSQGVVIANHVTDGKEPYCFKNLKPQQYTLSFSSPLYDATTPTTYTFVLAEGEPVSREFGAVPKQTATDANTAAVTNGININLSTPVRIGLAAVAAVIAMAFVGAIGMILYSLFLHQRR